MPKPLPESVRAATGGDPEAVRAYLLDATHRVIVERGLSGASTRHIAAEAGIAGGTLYNYFEDRTQLVAGAILRRTHILARPIGELPSRAGTHTVRTNLEWFACYADEVLEELVPLIAAAFGEPALLATLREQMAVDDPVHVAGHIVTAYLLAEQALGRVAAGADCAAAGATLVSLCHDRAFQQHFRGGPTGRADTDSIAPQIALLAVAVEP